MTEAVLSPTASVARRLGEDGLALIAGIGVLILALVSQHGPDLLGWAVTTSVWVDPSKAIGAISRAYGGAGALAAVYLVSLFGFVIWVGLIISWPFFAGVKPPLVG